LREWPLSRSLAKEKENHIDYETLTLRNRGYISPKAQKRIHDTSVLIAGCGMGSTFAETAVRLGYEKLILADHDTIAPHNLNRQNFTTADIGCSKVGALAKRLRAINPNAQVEALCEKITARNAMDFVGKVDLVFDTIDFIDLSGLVALHDACHEQEKPLVTAVNAGFGAAGFYFPGRGECTIRDIFGLPAQGSVEGVSYGELYGSFIQRIAHPLDPLVLEQFAAIVASLSQGKPCPAPQVAPGAACVAALAGTIACRIAEGLPIIEAPNLLVVNMNVTASGSSLD
jgi:molybdopterin/thiamine biosynthesis adenylyltransferase